MNSYFQFKQFTVHQDKCAMKVCTDACLFGAVTANIAGNKQYEQKVLDIGTGTGLLALMYAQKNSTAIIDAVEIDEAAAQQAAANFAASPWGDRLRVHNISIQQFASVTTKPINLSTNQLFDLIISNPPFFENDLKSDDTKRNLALHSNVLSLAELLHSVNATLKDDGIFGVLLPYHRTGYFEKLALENRFYLFQKILVKQTPKHNYFRSILFFTRKETTVNEREITVKGAENQYTPEFIELLKDYYLYL